MTTNNPFELAAKAAKEMGFSEDFVEKVRKGKTKDWDNLIDEAEKRFGEEKTIRWLEKNLKDPALYKVYSEHVMMVRSPHYEPGYDVPPGPGRGGFRFPEDEL